MLPFMMGDKGKKSLTLMVEKGPEVKEMEEKAESDYGPGKDAAASDIINAIEKKDIGLLRSALEDIISMCMDEYESSEMEDEEEPSESPNAESEIADKLRKKLGWK
jgi:hypothetical protein